MICVVLLLPSGAAEAEGEHGGQDLHGHHADHRDDHHVELGLEQIVDCIEAATVHVGVCGTGIGHTIGVLGHKGSIF